MCHAASPGDDGVMTEQPPPGAPGGTSAPDDTQHDEAQHDETGFEAGRLRSIADARRSSDDRLVAGVSTGVARHLDVDPVLVRIVFAALTFVGGAGIILYAAAWFLLPADDSGRSIAADWFNLDDNEEKVRKGGLVIAGVVAILSVVGDSGWGWGWGGAPWGLVPLALLVYVFVVRPRRRREARAASTAAAMQSPTSDTVENGVRTTTYTLPRQPRSWALTVLTLSLTAIAVAVVRIIADSNGGTPWTTYVAVALTIVGVALLLSTVVGDGGPLVALGLVLSIVLGLGTLLPDTRLGAQQLTPTTAADVSSSYEHGVGLLELDLTALDDPDDLLGRTIELDSGVGQTKVVLPNGLNVAIESDLSLGEITVLDRQAHGTDNSVDVPADPGRALTLTIDQKVGNIEVIRQ
jgi:phage shock protein PspC (stress-responsive transcriptional regulator)